MKINNWLLSISIILGVLLLVSTGSISAAVVNNLVTTPTADITAFQRVISAEVYSGRSKRAEFVYRIDPTLELGAILDLPASGHSDYNLGPKAKLLLAPEAPNQPAIAAGIQNRDIYLTLSKDLTYGIRGHAGIGNGRFSNFFIGVNKVINSGNVSIRDAAEAEEQTSSFNPPVNIMAEYVDREINLGVRTNIERHIYLELGVLDLKDFKAGISVAF